MKDLFAACWSCCHLDATWSRCTATLGDISDPEWPAVADLDACPLGYGYRLRVKGGEYGKDKNRNKEWCPAVLRRPDRALVLVPPE